MKIPYNWLKEFIPIDSYSPKDFAEILLSIGFEVSEIIPKKSTYENIISAVVKDISRHPNADKLTVCTLTDGKNKYSIVCGAKNFTVGDIVPLALPDAILPDETIIKVKNIGNVNSYGMICSSKELAIDDNQSGIMLLPKDTPVGINIKDILPDISDTILDIEIPPNRPDCLSIIGIAKELAAKLNLPLKEPQYHVSFIKGENSNYNIQVEILSPEFCKRYIAIAVYDLKVQESIPQIKLRLKNCGLRPINNVVDIANYVMLEFGHPLHVFDLDKLQDRKIIVRTAKVNEVFNALDEKKYILKPDMLVIADIEQAQALAGIIGGKNSAIDYSTKNVLVESAVFNAENIRRTRRKLNTQTESSYRFERGAAWETADIASRRATFMIFNYCKPKFAIRKDQVVEIPVRKKILLRPQRVNFILNTNFEKENIAEILSKLGMEVSPEGENLSIGVPSSRLDINEEIDLIEEIIRIKGYDAVPIQLRTPEIPMYKINNSYTIQHKKICHYLTALGFYESINYGFNTTADFEKFQFNKLPVKIENPLSKETEFLRLSLLPNLLQNVQHNVLNGIKVVKLFELGKIFYIDENSNIKEDLAVGIIFIGNAEYDFYYLSNIVQNIIKNIFSVNNFELIQSKEKYFHQNKSAEIVNEQGNVVYAIFGLLNPAIDHGISSEIYFSEIYLQALLEKISQEKIFRPYSTFPKSKRDISILVPENIPYKDVEKEILATKTTEFQVEAELIDVYQSKKLPKGKKSYTVSLNFSHKTHTLTTDEVNKKIDEILERLAQLKIFLRTPLT